MYRLQEMSREELLARVRQGIRHEVAPPELEGARPDLASGKSLFFVAEHSDLIAGRMPAITAFARAGHAVVLAVPEFLKDPALSAWDYLPAAEKQRVRIMLVPLLEPGTQDEIAGR